MYNLKHGRAFASSAKLCKLQANSPTFISTRTAFFNIFEEHKFNIDPSVILTNHQTNSEIHIYSMAHWVDLQNIKQNHTIQYDTKNMNTFHDWIASIQPSHIFLDICPSRLQFIHEWLKSNPKPETPKKALLSATKNENNIKDEEEDEISERLSRFVQKCKRLDLIEKIRLAPAKTQISKEAQITEPQFNDTDLWYFDLYWSAFEKYFGDRSVPHWNEFRQEFYLTSPKWRQLSLVYGEEISIVIQYFQKLFENENMGNMENVSFDNKYIQKLPKMTEMNQYSRSKFDDLMTDLLNEKWNLENENFLMGKYFVSENENIPELIAGGMPIEFLFRELQKMRRPMTWIEFGVAMKNFYRDKQILNFGHGQGCIFDLAELAWIPAVREMRFNGWDSTYETIEMLSYVVPEMHRILFDMQGEYVYKNLMSIGCKNGSPSTIVAFIGQGLTAKIIELYEKEFEKIYMRIHPDVEHNLIQD